MVSLVRNALLVAGHEMGANGDHWPVIKSTIHSIMKDWEDLKSNATCMPRCARIFTTSWMKWIGSF